MHPKLSPWEEIQVHSLVLLILQARLLRLDSNFPGSRAILAQVFHKVELRCSCWFRFFIFLNQGCNFVFANW